MYFQYKNYYYWLEKKSIQFIKKSVESYNASVPANVVGGNASCSG